MRPELSGEEAESRLTQGPLREDIRLRRTPGSATLWVNANGLKWCRRSRLLAATPGAGLRQRFRKRPKFSLGWYV